MARRKTLWTPDVVRERIRTTQLLKRLQDYALGVDGVKMKPTQVKAAQFLISRMVGPPREQQDLNINGNLTAVFADPTQRPNGYNRKPVQRD